jgi:hypothetical protein
MKWPYSHLPLSLLISAIAAGIAWGALDLDPANPVWWLVGPAFYWLREEWQFDQNDWWDQRGFIWGSAYPLAAAVVAAVIYF